MNWFKKIAKKQKISKEEAKKIGDKLNINWKKIDLNEFIAGINIELEHGSINPKTDVIGNDKTKAGKITLAHLFEIRDYYTKLKKYVEN